MSIVRITCRMLAERYHTSERFWERRRAAMRQLGLLTKNGRSDFGNLDRIDRAIMSGEIEALSSGE